MNFERLRGNLSDVRRRIADACRRSGRRAEDVTLVVVTKTAPPDLIALLAAEGVTDVGENRAVEGLARVGSLRGLRRHMIGQLQTNKVKKALAWADVLHSVDRPSLLEELEGNPRKIPVYVQVNVSGEESKAGYRPEEAEAAVAAARRSLQVLGLMTMAPEGSDARPHFRRLRELAGRCGLAGLSMGMTQDFEAAVEEGATALRVGTAVFEGVLL
jgi:hypothetical protein